MIMIIAMMYLMELVITQSNEDDNIDMYMNVVSN